MMMNQPQQQPQQQQQRRGLVTLLPAQQYHLFKSKAVVSSLRVPRHASLQQSLQQKQQQQQQQNHHRRHLSTDCDAHVEEGQPKNDGSDSDPDGVLHHSQEKDDWTTTTTSTDCQDNNNNNTNTSQLSPLELLKEKTINEEIQALGKQDKWKEILCLYHESEEDFTALNYETVMIQLGRIRSVHAQRHDDDHDDDDDDASSTRTAAATTRATGAPTTTTTTTRTASITSITSRGRTLPRAAFLDERHLESFMTLIRQQEQARKAHHHHLDDTDYDQDDDDIDAEDPMNGPLFEVFYTDLGSKLTLHGTRWMGARAVARILHNIAKLDLVENDSTDMIFDLFEDDSTAALLFENGDFCQDIANCAWACASLDIRSPNLFRLLDQNAEWMLQHGNQEQLSDCAWACGVLGVRAPNLSRLLLLNQSFVAR